MTELVAVAVTEGVVGLEEAVKARSAAARTAATPVVAILAEVAMAAAAKVVGPKVAEVALGDSVEKVAA